MPARSCPRRRRTRARHARWETSPTPYRWCNPRTPPRLPRARSSHHAPHHRLAAAVQRAVASELHDLARDLRFGREIHRGVGVVPIAFDAEPLEFLALHIEPMRGVVA